MSLRVNQNVNAINAHNNILKNDQQLSKSLERLSSGLKVNRAGDNPSALVISEQMRGQITSLDQAIKNSEVSISMIQTAEGALTEVNNQLVSLRQLALHAANEGANDEVMLTADQNEIDQILESIDRISSNTQFGGKKLLDGSNGVSATTSGADLAYVSATEKTQGTESEAYTVRVTQPATKASKTGTTELSEDQVEEGEVLTIFEGGKSATYRTTANDTVTTAIGNLGSVANKAGLDVEVTNQNGKIQVKHKKFGSEYSFQVMSSSDGVLSSKGGSAEEAGQGKDIEGMIDGEAAVGVGTILIGVAGNKNTEGLAVKYDPILTESKESSWSKDGVDVGTVSVEQNALTFQIGANRNQTVNIALNNMSTNMLGERIDNSSGFRNLGNINVLTPEGAQDSIMLIDQAINEVSMIRGRIGSFQKNTLETNLVNLRVASENMIAAESSIRDTDIAQETANLTKNKIMVQSGIAIMAQANHTPKTVIELLYQ